VLRVAMTEWRAVYEAASIEPVIHKFWAERQNLQIGVLAEARRAGAPTSAAEEAEIYAGILPAPLAHYFQPYIRDVSFDAQRVLDTLAEAWMTLIARARSGRTRESR
jgi:hypothetical protein